MGEMQFSYQFVTDIHLNIISIYTLAVIL